MSKGFRVLFTRFTMMSAHLSIIPEFLEKISLLGLENIFNVNKTEVVNTATTSDIIFRGIKTSAGNQTANLKSLQGVSTWVYDESEEEDSEDRFDTIDLSIRQKGIKNRIILILNPTTKEHWIYKRFFESKGVPAGFNGIKDNVCYIHSTYLDNKDNLSESYLKQIENIKDTNPEKYRHKIMGGWLDKADGVIFTNWRIDKFNENIESIFGQDYGFSIDPTTLIEVAIDNDKKKMYVRECYGKQGLSTNEIFTLNKHHAKDSLIIGDSAEPRLISELEDRGQNIEPAIKGQGSITSGISLMQDFEIIVDPSSLEIIKEFNNYIWLSKKANVPIDSYNHRIDPMRYVLSYYFANQNKGIYNIL